ncbi:DUF1766-domain-containing protein [Cutaneotrichosporon oleaginosum]|uniref:DUF1766-domain-containing protein n=1 Tax=Cutaneotrichosporon oleaginosum TaxID=879819 RepID=A0A0J0XMA2_9TREE|nr:DUF1766-domain-containing protein [Cutaneotrichosporon oleaginosum]KLT42212.1 DUF1766-domain-containing protein [Cutaneotrichosporon oleaginosum]TXT11669.1 hypothetical protein COLE_02079 [Cutaneotrichosporon oleaginosum]
MSFPSLKPARPLSHSAASATAATPAASSSTPTPKKKLTKLIPTAPSGVSFMSPLYAAASNSKKSSSEPNQSPSPATFRTPPPRRGRNVIDLTLDSDEETPESSGEDGTRRTSWIVSGASGISTATKTDSPKGKKAKHKITPTRPAPAPPFSGSSTPPRGPLASTPVRCAGYTRAGTPCKRLVRARAPLLATPLANDGDAPRAGAVGRYCRDHAGMVCAADGFYWRDARGKAGVYIDFKDYIPSDLGQQTQALLRVTMDSPLTAKEMPGFLYAYELRTRSGAQTAYFKVGRSDNVPRRMGQWSAQCGYIPTLRDVFPLKARAPTGSGLARAPSIMHTFIPGATKAGTDAARMVPAVKRWERLVHLELADRAAASRPKEYEALSKPCSDCGMVHQEIFPLEGDPRIYERLVVDVIERWERFVRVITET